MSPSEKRETARRLLAERARRVNAIRRGIVAGALAAFVMAWGVVAWTGSMGTTTSSSAAATDTTSSSDTGTTQSSGRATQSGGNGAAPSPMTTHQS